MRLRLWKKGTRGTLLKEDLEKAKKGEHTWGKWRGGVRECLVCGFTEPIRSPYKPKACYIPK